MAIDTQLYGPRYSTYTRTVRLALAEKGIDYDLVEIDFLRGAGATPEHRARHPFGKVPVIKYGEHLVYETGAILQFIEDVFDGSSLVQTEPHEKALMNQITGVLNAYVYPPLISTIVVQHFIMPIIGGETDLGRIAKAVPQARKALGVVNDLLGENPFLAGTHITHADLYLIPMYDYFSLTPEGGELLPEIGNLARWWKDIKERPSVIDTAAPIA
jgi:glutathione S-transferase